MVKYSTITTSPIDYPSVMWWGTHRGFKSLLNFVREDMKIRDVGYTQQQDDVCEAVFLAELIKHTGIYALNPIDFVVRLPFNPEDGSNRPGAKIVSKQGVNILIQYDPILAGIAQQNPDKVPIQIFPVKFYEFDKAGFVSDGLLAPRITDFATEADIATDAFYHGAAYGEVADWVWSGKVCDAVGQVAPDCPCGEVVFNGLSNFSATKNGVSWALPSMNLLIPKELLNQGKLVIGVEIDSNRDFKQVDVQRVINMVKSSIMPALSAIGFQEDDSSAWTIGGKTLTGPAVLINKNVLVTYLPLKRSGSLDLPIMVVLEFALAFGLIALGFATIAYLWHYSDNKTKMSVAYDKAVGEYYNVCKQHPELCATHVVNPPTPPSNQSPLGNIAGIIKWGAIAIVAINLLPALSNAVRPRR